MRFSTSIPQSFFKSYEVPSEGFMEKLEDKYQNQGWFHFDSQSVEGVLPQDILSISHDVDYIVSIGVGGSYIGLQCLCDFVGQSDKWLFLGPSLDPQYIDSVLSKLKGKKWGVLFISKSGETLEVQIFFNLLKQYLKLAEWVITTSSHPSFIKPFKDMGISSLYFIPISKDTGGRYSLCGSLGFLTLFLLGQDYKSIYKVLQGEKEKFLKSYKDHPAFLRGVSRFLLQKHYGVKVETLSTKEENLESLLSWEEQLWAESSGKEGQGLYMTRLIYPRDAHSVGQILAQGPRLIAETFFSLNRAPRCLQNLSSEQVIYFKNMGDLFLDSIIKDRLQTDIIVQSYEIEENVEDLFRLLFCEMLAVSLEGYLMRVNPYNQPGVEGYKEKIRAGLSSLSL